MHRIVSREIDETFREADGACWLRELAGVACALALTEFRTAESTNTIFAATRRE